MRALLNALLYLPSRDVDRTPADEGLSFRELEMATDDGERLHGWSVQPRAHALGHVLLFHGNGGNIADRVPLAALLSDAGFGVLLFDPRGYGRSSGRPGEQGTYRDARAALDALLREPGVDPARIVYLGESLGAAMALELALEHPPAGLVLLSAFTSIRDMARLHYRIVPRMLVPDAYPSLRRVRDLRAPLLVLHGADDMIVPCEQGRALFDAAPEPRRLSILPGVGHNDIVALAGRELVAQIASWWSELRPWGRAAPAG
jgi:uncharacterized protein